MIKNTSKSIVCFGEVLWDIFPDEVKPGGAPLNVAYHLKRLGMDSHLISRVGTDTQGIEFLNLMKEWGIDSTFCQMDNLHPTGHTVLEKRNTTEVTYEIIFPVAWDFIQWERRFEEKVAASDAFVFGSVIMRNNVSKNSLMELLCAAKFRIFDVNLRTPYHSSKQVLSALEKTELLKLNYDELVIISDWINPKTKTEEEKIHSIQDRYNIKEIILTKGKNGAVYYKENEQFQSPVYPVQVVDTVGCGDAFLAAFLSGKFSNERKSIAQQLQIASALGAFVASSNGACPAYNISEIKHLINQNYETDKS